MSSTYPPPDPYGGNEGQPPPYGGQYGQPYGGPGQPAQPGQPPGPPPGQQPAGGQWGPPQQGPWGGGGYGDYAAYTAYQENKRPGTVLAGAIMAYVGAGLLLLLGLLMLIGSASASFIEGFAGSAGVTNASTGLIRGILLGIGLVAVVLAILVIVLAAFAQKGRNGARIGLTIVGGIYLLLALVSAIIGGTPQTLIGIVYVGISTMLFWLGRANDWYRAQKIGRQQPAPW